MSEQKVPDLKDASVRKIMDLLSDEFNDLKVFIDQRIEIRKAYDKQISNALYDKKENTDSKDNLNKKIDCHNLKAQKNIKKT